LLFSRRVGSIRVARAIVEIDASPASSVNKSPGESSTRNGVVNQRRRKA
jgi:hypothetical protein